MSDLVIAGAKARVNVQLEWLAADGTDEHCTLTVC